MKLRIALEEKLQDVRLRDRLLAEGKITKEDIKKFQDKLNDESANAVAMEDSENQ
jgi:polyhydroxyalkanoate synthesis regulator phasin